MFTFSEHFDLAGNLKTPLAKILVLHLDYFVHSSNLLLGPHREAFIIIAKGLVGNWEVPILLDFDVSKEQLYDLYKKAILELEKIGFKVLISVKDMGPKNRSLQKHYNISSEKNWIENPFDPSRKVFFAYDYVHCTKNARNHCVDDVTQLPSGKTFTKTDLLKIIDHLKKNEMTPAHFLNDFIILLKSSDRQTVSPCLKLFSKELAKLIRKHFPDNQLYLEIADFFESMSNCKDTISFALSLAHLAI